jgi:hypothetical protein
MTDRTKVEIEEIAFALAQEQQKAAERLARSIHEIEVIEVVFWRPKFPEPPKLAEFLLILCSGSGKRAEAIQGDLCEQFTDDCAKMSVSRARRRYWSRVLASLGPQIGRTIARVTRWAAILSLVKKLFMAG